MSIRNAANRSSRKPFSWGGLAGYRQLEAISVALHELPLKQEGMEYFQQLVNQVDEALGRNRALADDISSAHDQLIRIAQCLGYPTPHNSPTGTLFTEERRRYTDPNLTSTTIRKEMEGLLEMHQSTSSQSPAQTALSIGFGRRWKSYGVICSTVTIFQVYPPTISDSNLFSGNCEIIPEESQVENQPAN